MIPTHRPFLAKEELDAVARLFETRWLGKGSVTEEFEDSLREFLGAKHVLSVSTGTSALHLAVEALDLESGSEVLVPSITFPSSVQAIVVSGARPVFCEVDPFTLNLNVADALSRITPRTRVVMPVHYGGLACEMDEITAMARDNDFAVVEDAAHAFGSTYKGHQIGTIGDLTCFSFDPIKNITCGGGGAIATNSDDLASQIRPLRNIGIDTDSWSPIGDIRPRKYQVVTPGYRYLLSNLNAAIGLEQLKRINVFKDRKRGIVRRYDEAFQDLGGLILLQHNLDETFPFSYVIRVLDGRRNELMEHLKERGIGSAVQFFPNHLQPAFAEFRTALPVTERLCGEILTLPLYYEMSEVDISTVINGVQSFFRITDE